MLSMPFGFGLGDVAPSPTGHTSGDGVEFAVSEGAFGEFVGDDGLVFVGGVVVEVGFPGGGVGVVAASWVGVVAQDVEEGDVAADGAGGDVAAGFAGGW